MSEYPDVEVILDMIEKGILDDHLTAVKNQIDARRRTMREFVEFIVGDRVMLNNLCGTKYLQGEMATITSLRRTKVNIKLDRAVGRFTNTQTVIVPTSILDKA